MVRAQRTCSSLKCGTAQRAPGNWVSGRHSRFAMCVMLAKERAWIFTLMHSKTLLFFFPFGFHPSFGLVLALVSSLLIPG